MFNNKLPSGVIFESINVNSINTLSGIFIGDNSQWYWKSQSKSNSAFGSVHGEGNILLNPLNIVIDPDQIDNPQINYKGSGDL